MNLQILAAGLSFLLGGFLHAEVVKTSGQNTAGGALTPLSVTVSGCIQTGTAGDKLRAGCSTVQDVVAGTGGVWNTGQLINEGSGTVKGADGLGVTYGITAGTATFSKDITVNTSISNQNMLKLNSSAANSYWGMEFQEGGAAKALINYIGSGYTTTARQKDLEFTTTGIGDINFWPGGNKTAEFTYDGKIGLRTVGVPEDALHIDLSETPNDGILVDRHGDEESYLKLRRSRGTHATPTAVQLGDRLGSLGFKGHGSSVYAATCTAGISGMAEENFTDDSMGSGIAFYTSVKGSSIAAEMVRMSNAGNMGIGTSAPAVKLHISSGAVLIDGTGVTLTVNGTIAGNVTSASINLSTVTAAIDAKENAGVAASSVTSLAVLVGASTQTLKTAMDTKLSSAAIPGYFLDLSTVTSALADKLSTTAGISPLLIDLSTVTSALSGKLSTTEGISPLLIDLSTVTTALSGKQAAFTGISSACAEGQFYESMVTANGVVTGGACKTPDAGAGETNTFTSSKTFTSDMSVAGTVSFGTAISTTVYWSAADNSNSTTNQGVCYGSTATFTTPVAGKLFVAFSGATLSNTSNRGAHISLLINGSIPKGGDSIVKTYDATGAFKFPANFYYISPTSYAAGTYNACLTFAAEGTATTEAHFITYADTLMSLGVVR